MQTITKITAQKRRGRYNIFLDDKYAFPVSESTLIKFRLAKGLELEPAQVAAIKNEEVAAVAKATALNYISHQMRTVHEVRQRLREDEVPEDVITQTTDQLKTLHILDDSLYADTLVRDNLAMGERGPRQVEQRLRTKGIHERLAAAAVAQVTPAQWAEVALRVAQKTARRTTRRAFNDQQNKIRLALMQKGFTTEQTTAALASLALDRDDEAEAGLLEREAAKQWRLKRKYEGYERTQRVRLALLRKGFQNDAIDEVLQRLAQEDD